MPALESSDLKQIRNRLLGYQIGAIVLFFTGGRVLFGLLGVPAKGPEFAATLVEATILLAIAFYFVSRILKVSRQLPEDAEPERSELESPSASVGVVHGRRPDDPY